jgi:hypothetical protein
MIPKGQGSRHQLLCTPSVAATARNVFPVYAPVQKTGVVLQATEPWEPPGCASFCSSIVSPDNGRYRMYYSVTGKRQQGIAVAESADGLHWEKPLLGQVPADGQQTNRIAIDGLPGEARIGQPQVVRLPSGLWRMYFWYHAPGHLRYTVAESVDGLRWMVKHPEKPALYHPKEIWEWGVAAGQLPCGADEQARVLAVKALRTNDATHIYYNAHLGCYECYSVLLLPAIPERRVEVDNVPTGLRVIQRRVSEDGLEWSSPELVILPDERDPWDQQFYHLAVQWHDDWMIGSLGHYRVEDGQQTQDLELCFSRDGRQWYRPLRGGFIPRGSEPGARDAAGVYPPNAWIDLGERWLCLYSGTSLRHNEEARQGSSPGAIMGATFAKNRFVGLAACRVPGGLLTDPFFPENSVITLDAHIRGWLRAELCDVFGRKIAGFNLADSLPVTGDSERHVLRWSETETAAFRHDALRLRFEFVDGEVFGISY